LGIETDHEAQVFGQGLTFFHLENWYSAPTIVRIALELMGLYPRTLEDVSGALENAGIEFIEENGGGPGVRLRNPQRLSRAK
jgi:hypothetical protein